jgi:glycosyltransferase involved in cell wall biosynthesis
MRSTNRKRRIAIVHDWLPLYGGAERVLEQMLQVYPEAEVFSLIDAVPQKDRAFLQGHEVTTSFVQRLPKGKSHYRHFFPLMPLAIEQFDMSSFDLVISSSYAFAKGALTGPGQLHLCYCHSPIRYAWDLQHQYLRESKLDRGPLSWLVRGLLHYIRLWDCRTAAGVDDFMANSKFVARRIEKVYRRQATVVYPPVNLERYDLCAAKEDFYFSASRLVPYKRMDLLIEAFNGMPNKRLILIGDGPELPRLKAMAAPNVELLGWQSQESLTSYLQRARAFLFAGEEDFGIVLLEAQACGTPVVAYGRGGALETVVEGETGMFFPEQTSQSVQVAIKEFEDQSWCPEACRRNADLFRASEFRRRFQGFVEDRWEAFDGSRRVL